MSHCSQNHQQALETLSRSKAEYLKYESSEKLTWCSGCGDYGIQKALQRALTMEKLTPQDVLLCYDIGCHGNGSDKVGATTLHGLHGRVLSAAAGASIANSKIKVIASAGDGGTLSEGIGHLVHAIRSNYSVTFILHNNNNYGLTIGQASATTRKGMPMNGSPDGVFLEPMNPTAFVLGLGPTFVARTFSGDVNHMTEMLRAGLNHRGFAFIEVMQVCPTFNKATPQDWYWQRVKPVTGIKGYDPSDLRAAREIAEDLDNQIAIGVLYQDKNSVPFLDRLPQRQGRKTTLVEEVRAFEMGEIFGKLAA